MEVAPKRVLVDEWYIGVTRKANDIEEIFALQMLTDISSHVFL